MVNLFCKATFLGESTKTIHAVNKYRMAQKSLFTDTIFCSSVKDRYTAYLEHKYHHKAVVTLLKESTKSIHLLINTRWSKKVNFSKEFFVIPLRTDVELSSNTEGTNIYSYVYNDTYI